MPTAFYRLSIALTNELEDAIYNLRAKEEFRRLSVSEIVRRLIIAGLESYSTKQEG